MRETLEHITIPLVDSTVPKRECTMT